MTRPRLPRAMAHERKVGWRWPSWGSATTRNPARPAQSRAAALQVRRAMGSRSQTTRRARVKMSSVTKMGWTVANWPK